MALASVDGPAETDVVLDYVLGPRDALAWERVDPAARRRDRLALMAALLAGFGLLSVLHGVAEGWRGLHSVPGAMVVLLVPVVAVRALSWREARRRALARLAAEVAVRLEIGAGRIVERRADRAAVLTLGLRALRLLRETGEHLFLSDGREVVILPLRALGDVTMRRATVARLRARMG